MSLTTLVAERRKDLLEQLWNKEVNLNSEHNFSDGSQAIFLPGLKLEKIGTEIQLYQTGSEVYNIVETPYLIYAMMKGLRELSRSYVYSRALLFNLQDSGDKIKAFEKSNTPTLNKIKENYYDNTNDTKISEANIGT